MARKPKEPPMSEILQEAEDLHHHYLHQVQMNFPEEEWEERWKPLSHQVGDEMAAKYPSFAKRYGHTTEPKTNRNVSRVQGNFVNDIITQDKD
jgi:hypothetical protein